MPGILSMHTVSLGPVSALQDSRLLMPSERRAILPHDLKKYYEPEGYISDVSDTDTETIIVKPRLHGCLRDKSKKLQQGRRITFNPEKIKQFYPDTIYVGYEPSRTVRGMITIKFSLRPSRGTMRNVLTPELCLG